MYHSFQITDNIYYVGVNDRRKSLFENQLPLPHGVSYNAYLILDEKVALIDTADFGMADIFLKKIENTLNGRTIDYLIINHMEPDHSGSIRLIRERYPDVRLIGNAKTLEMVKGYFGITDGLQEVKDGEILELGKHRLQFVLTPMLHWPETMMTYELTQQILFSGDAFGTFGALNGGVVDESMNTDVFWDEMRRYYACIVGKYAAPVQKAFEKLQGIALNYICTTHGPVWRQQIARVLDSYKQWSLYQGVPGVVIAYGTHRSKDDSEESKKDLIQHLTIIRENSRFQADSLKNVNSPLIIVDEQEHTASFNSLNPNDIHDITILKDASATSLYGEKGKNGVIIVNTKKATP